jgi:predicted helicase
MDNITLRKTVSGVLAFINPHGFLDNPTFRGMRWHLLKTFDKIYTLDLHGNSKKMKQHLTEVRILMCLTFSKVFQ